MLLEPFGPHLGRLVQRTQTLWPLDPTSFPQGLGLVQGPGHDRLAPRATRPGFAQASLLIR